MEEKQFVCVKILDTVDNREETDDILGNIFTISEDGKRLICSNDFFDINDDDFKLFATNPETWVYGGPSRWEWYFEVINNPKNEFNESEYDTLMNF